MYNIIKLNEKDNVAVAPMPIPAQTQVDLNVISSDAIPFGHKSALSKIEKNSFIYKYGQIIGIASKDILPGEHVHSHNLEFSEFERSFETKNNQSKVINDSHDVFF